MPATAWQVDSVASKRLSQQAATASHSCGVDIDFASFEMACYL